MNSEIRSRPSPNCELCGSPGFILYSQLQDRMFGAPGEWSISECPDPDCGLLWLDPRPVDEDLGKAYATYYTHGDNTSPGSTWLHKTYRKIKEGYISTKYGYSGAEQSAVWNVLGLIMYLHPGLREGLDADVYYLPAQPTGRLLEVGCGRGETLRSMENRGWIAEGVDFDINSVHNARSKGLNVYHGDLLEQSHAPNSFDAIVMGHVIEHLPNPSKVLAECHRILKPGGRLVLLTPNPASFGHKLYKRSWRGLEPPRHLFLFGRASLSKIVALAGFEINLCKTSVRGWKILLESRLISRGQSPGSIERYSVGGRIWGRLMEIVESVIRLFYPDAGEELVLVGKKRVR